MEGQLLSKLYDIGVLNSQAKLSDVENKLTVAAFCRRRLAVIMTVAKMAETVSAVRRGAIANMRTCCLRCSELGGEIHRTGPCQSRPRHHHRPCLPRHPVSPPFARQRCPC